MFVLVSLPLVGDGAVTVGATGADGLDGVDVLLTGACFAGVSRATFEPDLLAPKVSIASEMPERQRKTPSRLRVLIKADLEDDCFFIWLFSI
jgi:hypothetical protein